MEYRIGLDVGSTTAKMVVVDSDGKMVWSRYERHNAQVRELLVRFFTEAQAVVGPGEVGIGVTGSVGMQTAELLQATFVQEVMAAAAYARQAHPEAQALIDIGGEDSKVVLLTGGHSDLRMNGNCAGGTGAFIDQMAALLGISHEQMNHLALQSTQLHTIAARCGVFAKTDVQNLVSRNVPLSDICASIFHSIAVQTITTLAHGCQIIPPILFCGGPLTFLPALRQAFAEYMQLDENQFLVTSEGNLVPAIGSALQCGSLSASMSELLARLSKQQQVEVSSSLQPLFDSEEEYKTWQEEKAASSVQVRPMRQGCEQVVIGIDSGSTTTKIIAARPDGDILFSHYAPSLGNPMKAVADGLARLQAEAQRSGTQLEIVGSCSTGYGEELIKAAFALDDGIIETMAHYKAASRLMPDVSFILDIGGQDMKAIFVEQGVVTRMELNEACSSGCGTFLQTFAQSLGYDISRFAQLACTAHHPCDLGTRCTVFMNSKIKQVLRMGAGIADISAGLSYSVVNNCLYKVLKLKDISELGRHIVVQGGTMRNDAVVRAFEKLTGQTVARSSMPEMMGAYGCALHAAQHLSAPRTLEDMMATARYETRETTCKGCENHCHLVRYLFAGGKTYLSGNKCERGAATAQSRQKQAWGRNIYSEKYQLLFASHASPTPPAASSAQQKPRTIGIPRVLNIYENYPFWHRLLTECGFQVVLSSESRMQSYEQALCSVMSDNICFPAKLVHSHIADLARRGVERILMPYVVYEKQESLTAVNSYNCPIVSGYSDVIRSAMQPGVPVDAPVINFSNQRLLKRQIGDYLQSLGASPRTIRKAFDAALMAQRDYEQTIRQTAYSILAESLQPHHDGHPRLTILLAGRPYHADPLIQHRLSEMIAAMGIHVISEDIVRLSPHLPDGDTNTVRQWAYVNRIIKAAEWVAGQGPNVQFVQMTSFGCGPDAFIQDEVREVLRRRGKTLTLLKIDDVSNLGSLKLRVHSLVGSLQAQEEMRRREGDEERRREGDEERRREGDEEKRMEEWKEGSKFGGKGNRYEEAGRPDGLILVPHISEFVTPLLPALGHVAGYHIEVLPPSDAESASIGLRYANNEVCYPATLIVGDIIKALQSGHYDLSRVTVAMSQTGGQCRATNYAGLIRRAMQQAGFADVPLLTLGVTTNRTVHEKTLDLPWRKMAPLVLMTLLYADTIAKMYYAAAARETHPGRAADLRDKFLSLGASSIRHRNTDDLLWHTANAASEFNAISRDIPTRKVGIVGEIFLKFNHFAHQHITNQLMSRGIEIVPPLITPFFLQEFVNVARNKQLGLADSRIPAPVVSLLYTLASHRIRKFNRVGSRYRYFRPFEDIHEQAALAQGIVSPAAQAGEGWLLPAEVCSLAESDVSDVLSLQPFGCIANHVVSKGIENALRRRYPHLNLLSLDFDSGVSTVNVTNRLLLFASHIS